jgi:methyl-CpG-binding domain protein 4
MMLQEIYLHDPWKMLVGCILLNQTTRTQVDSVREELFSLWPDALEMASADPEEIATLIKPLGLFNRRARTLIKFSKEWVEKDWKEPIELHGIGKYAQDSWEIFQKNNYQIQPTDKELVGYLRNKLDVY